MDMKAQIALVKHSGARQAVKDFANVPLGRAITILKALQQDPHGRDAEADCKHVREAMDECLLWMAELKKM